MSSIIESLNGAWAEFSMLKHPFYVDWQEGKLTLDCLRKYVRQYYHHENAFPRYLSAIHTQSDDRNLRTVILENLIDEERGERNHTELWLRFSDSLGVSRNDVVNSNINKETQSLIDTFMRLCKSSVAEGLGATYAYESQIPEVAKTKIDGLAKFYNISDERSIDFFVTHIEADEWHSEETAGLLGSMSESERKSAVDACKEAAFALWNFLSGVQSERVMA